VVFGSAPSPSPAARRRVPGSRHQGKKRLLRRQKILLQLRRRSPAHARPCDVFTTIRGRRPRLGNSAASPAERREDQQRLAEVKHQEEEIHLIGGAHHNVEDWSDLGADLGYAQFYLSSSSIAAPSTAVARSIATSTTLLLHASSHFAQPRTRASGQCMTTLARVFCQASACKIRDAEQVLAQLRISSVDGAQHQDGA
jgi:hypothetical protein